MELVIGGFSQGKTNYVKQKYHFADSEIFDVGCDADFVSTLESDIRCGKVKCIVHLHLLIREWMKMDQKPEEEVAKLLSSGVAVITSDEAGCGIVPLEKQEREYREWSEECAVNWQSARM